MSMCDETPPEKLVLTALLLPGDCCCCVSAHLVQEAFLSVLPRLPETIRAAVKKCTISWVRPVLNSCSTAGGCLMWSMRKT
jgi:hypothetical protein